MYVFAVRRALRGLLTVWFVVTLVFVAVRLAGDPIHFLLPEDATPAQQAQVRAQLGLDRSIPEQYLRYLSRALQGDFGTSFRERRPVVKAFAQRLPATLVLAAGSFGLALALGVTAGVLAAVHRNGPLDRLIMSFTFVGQALPNFVLGIALILVFSMFLRALPSGGFTDWRSLILPVVTLGTSSAASIARLTRSGMLDVLRQDYIRTAQSKGLVQRVVIVKHALRNAIIPVVTILGMQAGVLIAGSVIVETVFAWPGVGRLIVTAVTYRDFPVLQFSIVVVSASVVIANTVVDLVYGALDPRISVS